MTINTDIETLKTYKQLKIELKTWFDGYSKGSWRVIDKINLFLSNIEMMFFGKEINTLEDALL